MKRFKKLFGPLGIIGSSIGFVASVIAIQEKMLPNLGLLLAAYIVALILFAMLTYAAIFTVWEWNRSHKSLGKNHAALPELFKKTQHLRIHLTEEKLNEYREILRAKLEGFIQEGTDESSSTEKMVEKFGNQKDKKSFSSCSSQRKSFLCEGINALLQDFMVALHKLTDKSDFTTLVTLLSEEVNEHDRKMIAIYGREPENDRKNKEKKYLQGGASLAAHMVDAADESLAFNELSEASEFHIGNHWPDMGDYVQSVAICQITENEAVTAVLQVDCPRKNAFPHELQAMLVCTAHALGTLFSISNYVRERFCESFEKDKRIDSLEAEKNLLEEKNQQLMKALQQSEKLIDGLQDQVESLTVDSRDKIHLEDKVKKLEQQLDFDPEDSKINPDEDDGSSQKPK